MIDYQKNLIVISAPSGAGKSTLIRKLVDYDPDFVFAVSHTTRSPRDGENEGKDYYFVSRSEFQEMAEKGQFLEWFQVHENYYGTSKAEIERLVRSGRRVILDIDVQGSLYLMERVKALYIFVTVKDISVLKQRLFDRGQNSSSDIEKRLENAADEMSYMKRWEHIIINDDLQKAFDDLLKKIYS